MKRVDAFVAGNSKSGTSAVCAYLDRHASVVLSRPKEPNYFARDLTHEYPEGAFSRMSEDEYEACFSGDGDVRIDGSACYLFSTDAARLIADHNPEARIIAVFREPVDFLFSYHLQMLRNPVSEGETIADFASALEAENDRREGRRLPRGCRVPQLLLYRERVRYAEHLSRFLDRFPRDQIRVYLYDDFRADNLAVASDALRFLGLDPAIPDTTQEVNRAVRIRSPRTFRVLQDVAHGRNGFGLVRRAAKAVLPASVRRKAMRAAQNSLGAEEKGSVPDDLRHALMGELQSEVEAFGQLIGRDVASMWGYRSANVGRVKQKNSIA